MFKSSKDDDVIKYIHLLILIYLLYRIYSVAFRRSAIGSRGHFDVTYLRACIVYYSNRYFIHVYIYSSSLLQSAGPLNVTRFAPPRRRHGSSPIETGRLPPHPTKKNLPYANKHHRRGEHFESPPPHARTLSIRTFTWWRCGPPRCSNTGNAKPARCNAITV